jgi:hypothetical protein
MKILMLIKNTLQLAEKFSKGRWFTTLSDVTEEKTRARTVKTVENRGKKLEETSIKNIT